MSILDGYYKLLLDQSHGLIVEISNFGVLEVGFCFWLHVVLFPYRKKTICMSCIVIIVILLFSVFAHVTFFCECPPLFTMAPGFTWAGDFRGRAGRRMAAGLCPAMPMASFGALDPHR
jgi:hypothetical protein